MAHSETIAACADLERCVGRFVYNPPPHQPRENLNLLNSPSKVDGNKHLISPAKLALEHP